MPRKDSAITSTKTISTLMEMQKQMMADLSEVNLKNLMPAMIMLTAMMSLTIQLLCENHQPMHIPTLMNKLVISSTLIWIYFMLKSTFLRNVAHRIKNSV